MRPCRGHVPRLFSRSPTLPQPPTIAVIVEGGLVQTTLIEGWPAHQPLPRIVVVDYDKEGATRR